MKIVYSPRYNIELGSHVFRTAKYGLVHDRLARHGLVAASDVVEPVAARWEELSLVHDAEFLRKARSGGFSPSELAQLELPWSPAVVEGFRLMAGGTILAARLASAGAARAKSAGTSAVAANLGGGFHHAHAGHGEGFCLFNDIAVAVRVLQGEGAIGRAAIVDCDVHHGNGTASIFANDPSVFTYSIHQQHNYPAVKPPSALDVGLPDGAGDGEYLRALERSLPAVLDSRPDLLFYVAGADPYVGDELGGLSLTMDGLRRRDARVLEAVREAGVPAVIVLAGGYARHVEDTAAIHFATLEEAVRLECRV